MCAITQHSLTCIPLQSIQYRTLTHDTTVYTANDSTNENFQSLRTTAWRTTVSQFQYISDECILKPKIRLTVFCIHTEWNRLKHWMRKTEKWEKNAPIFTKTRVCIIYKFHWTNCWKNSLISIADETGCAFLSYFSVYMYVYIRFKSETVSFIKKRIFCWSSISGEK